MSSHKILAFVFLLTLPFLLLSCSGGGRSVYEDGLKAQQEGKYKEAMELYQQVIDENTAGVWVEQAKKHIEECQAMLLYMEANEALQDGDVDKSKKLRRQAEELYFYEPDSLYLQGMYDLFDGEYEKAELSFLKLIHDYPAIHLGYLGMAHLDLEMGRIGNAIKNVDKAIRYTPNPEEKLAGEELLIKICEQMIEKPEYMDRIGSLLPATTQNPWVFYYVGYSYNHRPQPKSEEAVSTLSRGLANKDLPKQLQADMSAELALAYLLEGYGDKAERYINRALDLFPDKKQYLQLKQRIESAIASGLKPKVKTDKEKSEKETPKIYSSPMKEQFEKEMEEEGF